jgi:hypothetical protein
MRFKHLFILVLVLLVGVTSVLTAQSGVTQSSGTTRGGLMLFGGLSFPNGAFGKTDGSDEAGYAKQGFFGGAEIMFSLAPSIGIVLDGRYMINKLNEDEMQKQLAGFTGVSLSVTQYTGILPMGGIRLYTTGPIAVFFDAQAGYMFAKTPEITVTGPGFTQKVDAQNGKGFTYGASAGIDIGNTLVIGGTYIISKPKFDMTTGSGASATTTTMEQPMNMIQVWAGIRF